MDWILTQGAWDLVWEGSSKQHAWQHVCTCSEALASICQPPRTTSGLKRRPTVAVCGPETTEDASSGVSHVIAAVLVAVGRQPNPVFVLAASKTVSAFIH